MGEFREGIFAKTSNTLPLELNLINIQCLTPAKWLELESTINTNTILCITETHQKLLRFNIANNIINTHSFRENGDKKGGGLSILMQEGKGRKVEKVETKHKDILHVKCT